MTLSMRPEPHNTAIPYLGKGAQGSRARIDSSLYLCGLDAALGFALRVPPHLLLPKLLLHFTQCQDAADSL